MSKEMSKCKQSIGAKSKTKIERYPEWQAATFNTTPTKLTDNKIKWCQVMSDVGGEFSCNT